MCYENLITIKCKPVNKNYHVKIMNVCDLNAQSGGGKVDEIVQYIVGKDTNVCMITESQLCSGDNIKI